MNVFRKQYRPLNDAEKAYLEALKDKAQELYDLLEQGPNGLPGPTGAVGRTSRELSLAKTNLEQAVMWAVKDVTR
jgi:hypothetical protein